VTDAQHEVSAKQNPCLMYKSLLSLRNSCAGYLFYCYSTLLKFIITRTTHTGKTKDSQTGNT